MPFLLPNQQRQSTEGMETCYLLFNLYQILLLGDTDQAAGFGDTDAPCGLGGGVE